MSQLISNRGHFLLLQRTPSIGEKAVLTAEAYEKWYTLYLVSRDESDLLVEELGYDEFEAVASKLNVPPYCDHVPNPVVVEVWANRVGVDLCPLMIEMCTGRWRRDVLGEALATD